MAAASSRSPPPPLHHHHRQISIQSDVLPEAPFSAAALCFSNSARALDRARSTSSKTSAAKGATARDKGARMTQRGMRRMHNVPAPMTRMTIKSARRNGSLARSYKERSVCGAGGHCGAAQKTTVAVMIHSKNTSHAHYAWLEEHSIKMNTR